MLSLQSNVVLLPDETLDELETALKSIDLRIPSSYADPWGDPVLRDSVKSLTPRWSGEALITGSATQALMLTLQHLGRGKRLAVQVPCYFGVLRQARELEMDVFPWTSLDELECIGEVDAVLLTSNFTPPHGRSLSDEDKRRVSYVASRCGAWIIEDNAYEPLWFRRMADPISYDPNLTVRIGSLSKIVSPDFRIGFVRACHHVLKAIRSRKITMELSTPRIAQRVALSGITERAIARWRAVLNNRSDELISVLSGRADIARPDGGPYVTFPLEDGSLVAELQKRCEANGLLIDQNHNQYPDGNNRPYIRLHVGGIAPALIPEVGRRFLLSVDEVYT